MDHTLVSYSTYLLLAVLATVLVAHTLHSNGRAFLTDAFHNNVPLADSVNHLLVVGFYLVNLGFIALYLKLHQPVVTYQGVFEAVSGKMGVVLLTLGLMHFFNVYLFSRMRRQTLERNAPLPLTPDGHFGSPSQPAA